MRLIKQPTASSAVHITIKGVGVHWQCTVSNGIRQCQISCFDIHWQDVNYRGPEFYTSFNKNGKNEATGRTFDREQTISAVRDWIENKPVEQLYTKFNFIDEKKRQLEKIKASIIKFNPVILELSQNSVVQEQFSSYSLWFKNENRSCRIYYYGYEPNPRYIFYWDDTIIFEISGADIEKYGILIKKWVSDKAIPSILEKEFPEIEFGELSKYYERGNGIGGEFILSWDRIEKFYSESTLDNKENILQLIKTMREKGFDKSLRAGQSLYTLVLSRSRRYGLKEHQGRIAFSFQYVSSIMEVNTREGEKIAFNKIEYNETIDRLLKLMEQESIN